uniref:Terpene synthase N-terminal domain-containing protein n=1 Tax=Brassica oleracea var. oleracea TaxID=109376 RepID=A0A0D3D910_BRAOL
MVKRPELNEGEANRYSFEKVTKLRKEMSVEHSSSLASHIVDLKMILCTKKVLVDSLADLPCLSYHFDNEIEEVSKHAFERREDLIANENDLHTVSIIFRVFRTYGDYVLSDIFNIFKGNSGKFKKSLVEDVKGMLSFYEAVHFGTTTDHILDEASSLTLDHLKPLATGCRACPPHILKYAKSSPHISVPEQPSSGCKGQYYLL